MPEEAQKLSAFWMLSKQLIRLLQSLSHFVTAPFTQGSLQKQFHKGGMRNKQARSLLIRIIDWIIF